ncbi:hypothetical protein U9246_25065, partial [Escherichia coli]
WKGWAILLRQKQKKLIMLPSETMIWQPEFTDKTLSRKPGAVQYFGFLANRVCGEKLPQVYRALGMDKPEPVAKVCYAQMVKQFLSRDPFECVLCGGRMVYRRAIAGLNVEGLKKNARDISLLRYIPG